jgi:(d)CTP diphosphatase
VNPDSRILTTVVGALVERAGLLLLARRGPAERHPGLWELPGGKVEPGETPPEALRRELSEELGVEARIGAERSNYEMRLAGKDLRFIVLEAA